MYVPRCLRSAPGASKGDVFVVSVMASCRFLLVFVVLLGAWLSELARFFGLKVGEYSGSFENNYRYERIVLRETTVLVATMIDLGGLHQRSLGGIARLRCRWLSLGCVHFVVTVGALNVRG